jgi:hypothetical protein
VCPEEPDLGAHQPVGLRDEVLREQIAELVRLGDDHLGLAALRAAQHLDPAQQDAGIGLKVQLVDRECGVRWPNLQAALRDIGDARVRLLGDLDTGPDGEPVLLSTRKLERLRSSP